MLVSVYTCQKATLLKITWRGSYFSIVSLLFYLARYCIATQQSITALIKHLIIIAPSL